MYTIEKAMAKARELWQDFPHVPAIGSTKRKKVEDFVFNGGPSDGVWKICNRQANGSVGRTLEAIYAVQDAAWAVDTAVNGEAFEDRKERWWKWYWKLERSEWSPTVDGAHERCNTWASGIGTDGPPN